MRLITEVYETHIMIFENVKYWFSLPMADETFVKEDG